MFEFFSSQDDAISLLKDDHDKVKNLFDDFENAESRAQKRKIAAQIIEELKIHATIEEEIFYPALRRDLEKDVMNEADEEHHVAKVLVAELDAMDGSEDHYDAKMHVLAENIRHHIREEEGEMMPLARRTDIDMVALGEQMLRRKQQLKRDGVPASAEERMIRLVHNRADSPAMNAQKKRPASVSRPKRAKAAFSGSSKKLVSKTAARKKTGASRKHR